MNKKSYKNSLADCLKTLGLALLFGNALACQTFSQKNPKEIKPANPTSANTSAIPTPTTEDKKMSQEYISALQRHDRNILEKAHQAPANLPREIDAAIGNLDAESRELAVELVARQDSGQAGMFLLRRTADPDPNVATLAADNLGKVANKPKTEDLIAAIPQREDPFVRGKLYLAAGRREEKFVLDELRRTAANEDDKEAKLQSLAARVKRGGQSEKTEFLEVVRTTEPDDALRTQELLLYIDQSNLAKGMIPWLDNKEDVIRLGSDRQNMMARMCDVAIWTAHLLKIKLPFETTSMRNYTPEEIEAARKVLEILPE